MTGIVEVVALAVKTVAPFLPFLKGLGDKVGKKLGDVVSEKGGDAAWNLAEKLWGKITGRVGDDLEVDTTSTGVALNPDNEARQEDLATVLAKRLEGDVAFVDELKQLLGGEARLQEMVAGNRGIIERVRQSMSGAGTQSMRVGDGGRISNAEQVQ